MSVARAVLKYVLYAALAITVALAAVGIWQRKAITAIVENWDVIMDGAAWANAADGVDPLVAYLAAHPDSVSFALWEVGAEADALLHRADQPRSLASTVKVLVLAAYADAVAEGAVDPEARVPLAQWEALHLPGTDGGAHERSLEDLRQRNALVDDAVRFEDLAWAMIRHSDNAATDLLLLKLGRPRLEAATAAHGSPGDEVPFPLNGSFVLVADDGTDAPAQKLQRLGGQGREAIADDAWAAAQRLADDEAFRTAHVHRLQHDGIGLSLGEQRALAQQVDPRGTAQGYARLMQKVVQSPADAAWGEVMRAALQWPLAQGGSLANTHDLFGTKGGSLPGVLTATYFAQEKDGRAKVLSLFLENVPMALWAGLMKQYTQQELERRLLSDPAFAAQLHQRLVSGPPTADAER